MDIYKLKLYINTLKHLKFIQVYYRLYYFFRRLFFLNKSLKNRNSVKNLIIWKSTFKNSISYYDNNKSFIFLNKSYLYKDKIDWNYNHYGKLWTYNLNYFDFLNQKTISKKTGIKLIKDYIKNDNFLKDGKEPYPISIRGINWIKFLSENKINDDSINNFLYSHYMMLNKNLEYHLLGNHLLENAFSLLFASYFFKDDKLYIKSKKILFKQLDEQILNDGAHFELSPMYHQIIFTKLLDCIYLIKLNKSWKEDDLLLFLKNKAINMRSWLHNITYMNGNIPMVNDSTYNVSPDSNILFLYANNLGIEKRIIPLSDSGYRKINYKRYELLLDVGDIGPSYQPGHSHSDTFNFEFIKEEKPVIVDTGISTYENNLIRQLERQTSSHNTVQILNLDQSQIWNSFRVANRAKVTYLNESSNFIKSSHNGYKKKGIIHTRTFLHEENVVTIIDKINKSTKNKSKAFLHFYFSIKKPLIKKNSIYLKDVGVHISFTNSEKIEIDKYQLSMGFNKLKPAFKATIIFDQCLETKISI